MKAAAPSRNCRTLKDRRPSRRARQRGHVVLEIGVCLITLFYIMFGIMEYSRLLYAYNFVSYAARQATRYASLRGATSTVPAAATDITTYVRSLAVALTSSTVNVATTWTPDNQPGSTVKVVVTYSETPLLVMVMPNPITVNGSAQMVVLQ